MRPLPPSWLTWALVCIVCWGVFGFLAKLGSDRVPARDMQVLFTVGMLPLAAAAFLTGDRRLEANGVGALSGVLIGIFAGAGSIAYFAALAVGKASLVGPVTSLFPLVTVVLAIAFLRERMNRVQWVGVLLALVSVLILSV